MTQPTKPLDIMRTIRLEADRHGVPRTVALAFAWVESRFDPTLQGDLDWHLKQNGALYRRLVRDAPRFAFNPARLIPEVWHSYGLFQLLAPYHTEPREHPHALLDPRTNTQRGMKAIATLLQRAKKDPRRARLAYVGGGLDGQLLSVEQKQLVIDRLDVALDRFREG